MVELVVGQEIVGVGVWLVRGFSLSTFFLPLSSLLPSPILTVPRSDRRRKKRKGPDMYRPLSKGLSLFPPPPSLTSTAVLPVETRQ